MWVHFSNLNHLNRPDAPGTYRGAGLDSSSLLESNGYTAR